MLTETITRRILLRLGTGAVAYGAGAAGDTRRPSEDPLRHAADGKPLSVNPPGCADLARGDPTGAVVPVGPFSSLSGRTIPVGTDLVQTSGPRRGIVIADTTLRDADVAAHPLAIVKTANGRYLRRDERPAGVHVEQFGADPTGAADSLPAILAALVYLKFLAARRPGAAPFYASAELHFGTGKYRLSRTLELHQQVHLIGKTRGRENAPGTVLQFPGSLTGIIVARDNTVGESGSNGGGLGSAEGSIIEGLSLNGNGGTSSGQFIGSGVLCRATCQLLNVTSSYFPYDGISVVANDQGSFLGNANEVLLHYCSVSHNGNNGLTTAGNNVNCLIAEGLFAGYNGGWGYLNGGSQPATFIGGHIVANGQYGSGLGQTSTSLVFHLGRMWQVYPGQAAVCSVTPPPSDNVSNRLWTYLTDYAVRPSGLPQWRPGIKLRDGGAAYMAASTGAHIGAYTEGAQGAFIYDETTLLSGNFGSGKRVRVL